MNRIARFCTVLAGALLISSAAFAQDNPAPPMPPPHHPGGGPMMKGHHGPPPGPHIPEVAEAIGLEEATRAQIETLMQETHTRMEPIAKELHEARRALHDLLESESPDLNLVHAQIDVISDFEAALFKERVSTMIQVRSMLTPEQREALKQFMPPHPPRHHGGPPPQQP